MSDFFNTIWQYHTDAGGEIQGLIIGVITVILSVVIFAHVCWPRKTPEISDEDFFSIVADEPAIEEIYEAMDKDDEYS